MWVNTNSWKKMNEQVANTYHQNVSAASGISWLHTVVLFVRLLLSLNIYIYPSHLLLLYDEKEVLVPSVPFLWAPVFQGHTLSISALLSTGSHRINEIISHLTLKFPWHSLAFSHWQTTEKFIYRPQLSLHPLPFTLNPRVSSANTQLHQWGANQFQEMVLYRKGVAEVLRCTSPTKHHAWTLTETGFLWGWSLGWH